MAVVKSSFAASEDDKKKPNQMHIPQFNAPSNRQTIHCDISNEFVPICRASKQRSKNWNIHRNEINTNVIFEQCNACTSVKWKLMVVTHTHRAIWKRQRTTTTKNPPGNWQHWFGVCTFFSVRKMICAFAQWSRYKSTHTRAVWVSKWVEIWFNFISFRILCLAECHKLSSGNHTLSMLTVCAHK